ncbi:hypothetical protein L798_11295 [Zootermopsis nevadensis]|uniref:Uncharacterized protein n=1 Tax=Zootermopsis nevadensis TaxID=136037 RepID=A0A067QYJ2_ZOONE|nr:hypothetical protein L798_11295 [Zootermopsis nevadensis]
MEEERLPKERKTETRMERRNYKNNDRVETTSGRMGNREERKKILGTGRPKKQKKKTRIAPKFLNKTGGSAIRLYIIDVTISSLH